MQKLSPGELQVVRLIGCEGLTTRAAAKQLGRPHSSVQNAATEILHKTGAKRFSQAVYLLTVAGELSTVDARTVDRGDEIEHRLRCIECERITKITHGESLELLKKFDLKHTAQTFMIECQCGRAQFVLQARTTR